MLTIAPSHAWRNVVNSEKILVAVSGGADSLATLDFLYRRSKNFKSIKNGNAKPSSREVNSSKNLSLGVCYVNHHDGMEKPQLDIIQEYLADKPNIPFYVREIHKTKPPRRSLEEWWREERYQQLSMTAMTYDYSFVVTGHNINDVAETWLWTTMNGNPKLIPYSRKLSPGVTLMRPMILTEKQAMEAWCISKGISFYEDPTNFSDTQVRARIRHKVMPEVLGVHKGFLSTIRNKYTNANGWNPNGDVSKHSAPVEYLDDF